MPPAHRRRRRLALAAVFLLTAAAHFCGAALSQRAMSQHRFAARPAAAAPAAAESAAVRLGAPAAAFALVPRAAVPPAAAKPSPGRGFTAVEARLAAFDTGRILDIPLAHFDLDQPTPAFMTDDYFRHNNQLEQEDSGKYFWETECDWKRDAQFAPQDLCIQDRYNSNVFIKSHPYNLTIVHESLTSLLKSWSQFAETNNIAWWIAHGEMIGWFWNAQLLPWDLDLDIQVSTYQLMNLIQFNQTVIDGRFLVDVNPYLLRRGAIGFNGMPSQNVIDARVVDTKTGHFMDITGLSRTTTARWVSCKSPHNYFLNDVLPLHETMLDGIKVWRPHAPITLMEQEYGGHVLTSDYFEWTDNDIVYPFYWNATENKWIHVPSTI